MTLIRCIDFETSDLPEQGGVIIEVGWTDLDLTLFDGKTHIDWYDSNSHSMFFGLGDHPMNPAAQAEHHIFPSSLADHAPFTTADAEALFHGADYLCAHNAKFEMDMLRVYTPDLPPFICTMKVARRVFPESESFGLQYLRYAHNLDGSTPRGDYRCYPPHRAGPDAWTCALLLARFASTYALDPYSMHQFTTGPTYYHRCPLGKWKGRHWSEVDTGYLIWMVNKAEDLDLDIKAAAQIELDNRRFTR